MNGSNNSDTVAQLARTCRHFAFAVARNAQVIGKECQKPSFFFKTRFLFWGFYLSEPIYVSLLSGCDEMSTKPSYVRCDKS